MKYQLPKLFTQSSESGFTIIESLVAILVGSILLAAIAPVLVISTATRVQARRIELATQAAKAFVDGVKSKTIPEDNIIALDSNFKAATAAEPRTLKDNATSYLLSGMAVPTTSNGLYCFNKDGSITAPNCTNHLFYIQAGKIAVKDSDPDKGQGYRLGIRVYRADAEFGSLTAGNDGKNKTQATFTGGLGDRKAPLVEMTTEIVRGQPTYGALCDRLGGCR